MARVSDQAEAKTWTGSLTPRDGKLPDLAALERAVRETSAAFRLRGTEAEVAGTIERREGRLVLRASGTGELFALAPLTRKVQWDTAANRDQEPTETERRAFERLTLEAEIVPGEVRVTGPVSVTAAPALPQLQVRELLPVKVPR